MLEEFSILPVIVDDEHAHIGWCVSKYRFEASDRLIRGVVDGDDHNWSSNNVVTVRFDACDWVKFGCHEPPNRGTSEAASTKTLRRREASWFFSDVTSMVDRFRNTTCRKLTAKDRDFGENNALENIRSNIRG